MNWRHFFLPLFIFLATSMWPQLSFSESQREPIRIGSKRFPENYLLGEIFAQLIEDKGFPVHRRFGMGGTLVVYSALTSGEVDLYPEYTGTITEAITKKQAESFEEINADLSSDQVSMLFPLGFDNSYCVVMKKSKAQTLGIKKLSDLKTHPSLRAGFSNEFLARSDGWENLKTLYQLNHSVVGVELPLTYEAVHSGKLDFAEAYTTEPLIAKYGFLVLEDDLHYFPKYDAVILARDDTPSEIKKILSPLQNLLNNQSIMALNGQLAKGLSRESVANEFLRKNALVDSKKIIKHRFFSMSDLTRQTKTHLVLTLLAVAIACLVAIPLGSLLAGYKKLAGPILGVTGIMQTIPSIALLSFMIPFFGIGFTPALVGLFIYSLLPILRNTYVAMTTIDPTLIISARGIGLTNWEIFFQVKFPLAFPTILAGIRTATTLNIGTATLAAFIGAGGLGEPIVSGLALNDTYKILQGAIPAALLAIAIDFIFGLLNRRLNRV